MLAIAYRERARLAVCRQVFSFQRCDVEIRGKGKGNDNVGFSNFEVNNGMRMRRMYVYVCTLKRDSAGMAYRYKLLTVRVYPDVSASSYPIQRDLGLSWRSIGMRHGACWRCD
jgi:hypothetical protein